LKPLSSLFLLYLLFFLILCSSPLYVAWVCMCSCRGACCCCVAARIPACPEELFVQLWYQLCSWRDGGSTKTLGECFFQIPSFQFIQFSSSRMAAFMSFFISLTRWRTASSLFSLLLRDGFLWYLRSLSSLYIPSLITRFFSFCIARFGSSPRLTFTVIILLFSCYSVAAIRVSLNTTRVVYHIVKRLSSGRAPAQMGTRITQKVRCCIVLWSAVAVAVWRGFGVGVICLWFPQHRKG